MSTVMLFAKNEPHNAIGELDEADTALLVMQLHQLGKKELIQRRSVASFEFSVRVLMMCRRYGIETVGDLMEVEYQRLERGMPGFGILCIAEVAHALTALGIEGTAFHRMVAKGRKPQVVKA